MWLIEASAIRWFWKLAQNTVKRSDATGFCVTYKYYSSFSFFLKSRFLGSKLKCVKELSLPSGVQGCGTVPPHLPAGLVSDDFNYLQHSWGSASKPEKPPEWSKRYHKVSCIQIYADCSKKTPGVSPRPNYFWIWQSYRTWTKSDIFCYLFSGPHPREPEDLRSERYWVRGCCWRLVASSSRKGSLRALSRVPLWPESVVKVKFF